MELRLLPRDADATGIADAQRVGIGPTALELRGQAKQLELAKRLLAAPSCLERIIGAEIFAPSFSGQCLTAGCGLIKTHRIF